MVGAAQVPVAVALVVVRPAAGEREQLAALHGARIDPIEAVHGRGRIEHEELFEFPGRERRFRRPAGKEPRSQARVRTLRGGAPEERAKGVQVRLRRGLELLGEPRVAPGERTRGDQRVDHLVVAERGERYGAKHQDEAAHLPEIIAGSRRARAAVLARRRSARRTRTDRVRCKKRPSRREDVRGRRARRLR